MKIISDNEARQMITMFMEGATSNAEEKRLYEYFAKKRRIPADLEQYKDMMSWYAAGLKQPEESSKLRHINFKILTRITASICVILVSVFAIRYFINRDDSLSDEYALYGGSYVICNGVKSTNLKEIMPQLKQAEQIASANVSASDLLSEDPVIQSILDDCEDDDTRNFIMETLYQ